jgi:monovalent cation:H+ antiporter-2, CPA2 family
LISRGNMHVALPLTEIAIVALVALLCGLLFERLKQPAILGYVLTGILLSSTVLSDPQNLIMVKSLSELGVFLLLFVLGMEMNLRSFKAAWKLKLGAVFLQGLFSFGIIYVSSFFFQWSMGLTVVLAGIVTLSSTAVAIKMLEGMGELKTDVGRLSIGILIAQDIAIIPMLLLIQGLGEDAIPYGWLLLKLVAAVGLMVLITWYFTRRERVHIPFVHSASKNREFLPLLALTFCFGAAAITGLMGLSATYGAFLAGVVLGNTAERHQVIDATKPIQTTLLMVFFLSVGLLVNIQFILDNALKVSLLLLAIALGKTIINATILHIFKQSWSVSFLTSLVLAQLGEFSFVLAEAAMDAGIMPTHDYQLVMVLTALSLVVSPIWLRATSHLQKIYGTRKDTFYESVHSFYTYPRKAGAKKLKSITQLWRKK